MRRTPAVVVASAAGFAGSSRCTAGSAPSSLGGTGPSAPVGSSPTTTSPSTAAGRSDGSDQARRRNERAVRLRGARREGHGPGGRITDVSVAQRSRRPSSTHRQLAQQVIPMLRNEILSAQSARINAHLGCHLHERGLCLLGSVGARHPRGEVMLAGVIAHAEHVMGTVVSFHVEPGGCPAHGSTCRRRFGLHEAPRAGRPLQHLETGEPDQPFPGRAPRLDEAPPEMALVLEMCDEAQAALEGWFDPWAMPGGFDPTGLVKGWAAEQALAILRIAGVKAAIVNGGGDIAVFGLPNDSHVLADRYSSSLEAGSARMRARGRPRGCHLRLLRTRPASHQP